MMTNTQKFSMRKNKATKNLVAVTLFCGTILAVASATSVSADETTATTDTTVVATTETETATETETVTKAVENLNTELGGVVEEADKVTGVSITQGDTVEHATLEEAEADVAEQVKEIKAEAAVIEAENKQIKADFDADTVAYEKDKKLYDEAVKKREEALKNPKYSTTSDAFKKTELDDFLKNTDLSKVSYISVADENVSKLDASKLETLTLARMDQSYKPLFSSKTVTYGGATARDKAYTSWYDSVKNGKSHSFYNVKVNDTFTFSNVFVNADNGQYVGLKYTVKDIIGFDGEKLAEAMVEIRDGLNLTLLGDSAKVLYHLDFVDAAGKLVNVSNAILGFGDTDGLQSITVTSDGLQDGALAGEIVTVTKNGNTMTAQSKDVLTSQSTDTRGQVWFLLKNVTGFDYSFANRPGDGKAGNKTAYGWHQIGAIPFGIDIPEVPEAPTKPTLNLKEATLNYHLVAVKPIVEVPSDYPTVELPEAEIPAEPVKETPKPAPKQPVAEVPVKQAGVSLPSTGEAGSVLGVLSGIILTGLSAVGARKRRK